MSTQHCQVCHKECRPLRCTQCRNAFYCTVECQRVDWKAGHKRTCHGRSGEKVGSALKELFAITQGVALNEAQEQYHKATDEVERRKQEAQSKQSAPAPTIPSPTIQSTEPKERSNVRPGLINTTVAQKSPAEDRLIPEAQFCPSKIPAVDYFSVVAEEMQHISRFHITLRPTEDSQTKINFKDLCMSIKHIGGSRTAVTLHGKNDDMTTFAADLPRTLSVNQCSLQFEDDSTIQLRLQYKEDHCNSSDLGVSSSQTTIKVINDIHCRYCEQPLLQSRAIQRVCELPTGHWEEIVDYLICYSGQPVVDFSSSSASAEPKMALQDSNVLCIHQKDLGISACVLAVTGYGEEESTQDEKGMDLLKDAAATVRGDRSWRDVTGGATVCCSQCCSPLGFAAIESPESFRLFKHRLSVGSGQKSARLSTCASFLARELVRYAEAKAIFTCVVALDEASQPTFHRKCILLRLVSWESIMATSFQESSRRLRFRRVAKIVFEETNDKLASNETDDVTKWVWGGVDLCCAPLNGVGDSPEHSPTIGKVSTVRLLLQQDEYNEVLQSLRQGRNIFSQVVAEATILVKMGVEPSGVGDGLGLTAIPLDS